MVLRSKIGKKSEYFKKLYRNEKNTKQKNRYQALYLLSKKYDVKDVADIVGVSRRMINIWVNNYFNNGINGLKIKDYPGAKPKITKEIRKELIDLIETSPRKMGFNFSSWNTKKLRIWLKKIHNIEVTKPRIFQILKEEGYSWKKGEYEYILSDENEKLEFIKKIKGIIENLQPNQIILFQDECSVDHHPSLTHMWIKKGNKVKIPTFGDHKKKEFSGQ